MTVDEFIVFHHIPSMATRGPYESRPLSCPPKSLGERIRSVRLAWGWTQGELGQAVNTDQTAVSAWERGIAEPSGAAMAALSSLFGVTPECLETGDHFAPRAEPHSVPGERSASHQLTLPPAEPGKVTLVGLNSRIALESISSDDAIMRIIKECKANRMVWLVVEEA